MRGRQAILPLEQFKTSSNPRFAPQLSGVDTVQEKAAGAKDLETLAAAPTARLAKPSAIGCPSYMAMGQKPVPPVNIPTN